MKSPCIFSARDQLPIWSAFAVVPVTGRVVPDVTAEPRSLMLGVQKLGSKATGSFTLRSRTGGEFTVEAVEPTARTARVEPIESGADGAPSYRVVQAIDEAGYHAASIKVRARHEGGDTDEIEVPVVYVGVAAQPDQKKKGRDLR